MIRCRLCAWAAPPKPQDVLGHRCDPWEALADHLATAHDRLGGGDLPGSFAVNYDALLGRDRCDDRTRGDLGRDAPIPGLSMAARLFRARTEKARFDRVDLALRLFVDFWHEWHRTKRIVGPVLGVECLSDAANEKGIP